MDPISKLASAGERGRKTSLSECRKAFSLWCSPETMIITNWAEYDWDNERSKYSCAGESFLCYLSSCDVQSLEIMKSSCSHRSLHLIKHFTRADSWVKKKSQIFWLRGKSWSSCHETSWDSLNSSREKCCCTKSVLKPRNSISLWRLCKQLLKLSDMRTAPLPEW